MMETAMPTMDEILLVVLNLVGHVFLEILIHQVHVLTPVGMVKLCQPAQLLPIVMMVVQLTEMGAAQFAGWSLNGHVQEEIQVQLALVLINEEMVL